VVHALRILRCIAATSEDLGVASISRSAKVSPSTAFNILRTLVREHVLTFNDAAKTYQIGPGILDFAVGVLGLGEVEVIRPSIDNLALNVDMVVGLWRLTEDERMVLVYRAYGDLPVRVEMSIGHRLPYWSGAVGRALGASFGLSRNELKIAFLKTRWSSPPTFETHAEEVDKARQLGYAVDNNEFYRGVTSVAAIVTNARGKASFAVTGTAFSGQLDTVSLDHAGCLVRETAAEIAASISRLPAFAQPPSRTLK
jgi:DNA-binding IclR family transcriptional regulator